MNRGFWRHKNFLDAYILILKVQYRGPDYVRVKVEWWIRGRFIGIKGTYKIYKKDYPNWEHHKYEET